ncbi:unnamed protein product, partial [Ascophyllum nodosum]
LPYRQRQQERASRVRRDHKLALRTAFVALLLVTTSVVSAAATIQPPEGLGHFFVAGIGAISRKGWSLVVSVG